MQTLAFVVAGLLAAACGGGGGKSEPTPATKYKVGGTVSGLAGSGLVLHSSAGEDVPVTGNGAFTFPTALATGTAYAVTVAAQPTSPWQTCAVANGSGTMQAADVTGVAVTCTTNAYAVGGSVTGLAGSGLVLTTGSEDLPVAAGATTFAFPTKVASGAAYAVTVKTQPSSPSQTCAVTSGSGNVAGADVSSVQVACTTATFSVGGAAPASLATLSISVNGGAPQTLNNPPAGPFAFANVPSGAHYTVTATRPSYTCTVNNGDGVVGAANVTNLTVTCAQSAFTISGSIAGVPASGLTLSNGSASTTVAAGATTFAFPAPLATGASYAVAVQSPPAGLTCTVANGTGTIASANVTNVAVSCSSGAAAWTAPTTWGGVWADSGSMVQHAHFDASGIVSDKGPTMAMAGGAQPARYALGGFPAPVTTRYGAGPFPAEAVNYRASDAAALDTLGVTSPDFLVCAIVKPARNRPYSGYESPILAKGYGHGVSSLAGGGWVLMQMHESWCFHYEYKDNNGVTHQYMASIPNFFAGQDFHSVLTPTPMPLPTELQPDPSLVVVCAGRSGDSVVISANGFDDLHHTNYASFNLGVSGQGNFDPPPADAAMHTGPFPGPSYTLDAATGVPLTIGGYDLTYAQLKAKYAPGPVWGNFDVVDPAPHVFNGLVFETGAWNEAATAANIRAKVDAFYGTATGAVYARNREASIVGPDGKLHTLGRHAPRVDPAKGQVFGLQAWNRVSYWIDGNTEMYPYPLVFAAGENLDLWAKAGGATVGFATGTPPSVTPPNDNPVTPAQLVTLPAGAAISIDLDQALPGAPGTPAGKAHDRATWVDGPVQGQIWLRPTAASGGLTIQKTAPQATHGGACTVLGTSTTCEQRTVAFGSLTANQWNRVSLNGTFTGNAAANGKLVLANTGGSAISFYAWGAQLTQLGGGADLGTYDPAELMYDWSASRAHNGDGTNASNDPDDPFFTVDALRLPFPATPAGGFCLAAETTTQAGLPWNAFHDDRTVAAWVNDYTSLTPNTLRLFVAGTAAGADAGKLCAQLSGTGNVCGAIPAGLNDGNKHVLRACVSNNALRVAADNAQLASGAAAVALPTGGTLLVGNGTARSDGTQTPWHGYVSRVLVCPDNGGAAADCR